MIRIFFEGLLLGLSTGAYCLGTCLVFFTPYLLAEGKQRLRDNLNTVLLFMSGRFISYICFAVLVSLLGAKYRDVFTNRVFYFGLIIVSVLMLTYALSRNFGELKFCRQFLGRFSSARMPFVLGILSGLHPCMPFLAAAARVLILGSIFSGVVLFFAFFIGTSVYMIPMVFVSYLNKAERLKQIGLMMLFLSGIWFLCVGISGVIK